MNQILCSSFEKPSLPTVTFSDSPSRKVSTFFKYQFYFSIFLAILAIILWMVLSYNKSQKEHYSQELLKTYQIATLYATNSSADSSFPTVTEDSSFIIGAIRIDKIRIHYPILSTFSDENLEIAPCRIAGPLPNEIGNLCIAGHNYVDTKFFSRLHELTIQDTLWIYDLKGNGILYEIYDKYEVAPNDLTCLETNFDYTRELTLITCNNVTGNRLIIKAVEKTKSDFFDSDTD